LRPARTAPRSLFRRKPLQDFDRLAVRPKAVNRSGASQLLLFGVSAIAAARQLG
jgi:hypothetical protein